MVAFALAWRASGGCIRRARRRAHDAGSRVVRTPFVFVGNNEYQLEGVRLGARARVGRRTTARRDAPGMTTGEMVGVLGWRSSGVWPTWTTSTRC